MTRLTRSAPIATLRSTLRALCGFAALTAALVCAVQDAQAAGKAGKAGKGHANAAKKSGAARGPKVIDVCSWDHPGLRPFMGNVVNAIDRYQDIPAPIRARLKERMQERSFDEFVLIERDGIVGKRQYEPGITEMHFGNGEICRTVTRTKWTPAMHERGLVYCEQDHCILVPTVCRNVSRIRRIAEADLAIKTSLGGGDRGPRLQLEMLVCELSA